MLFVGAGGVVAQDNANFFWDDTNNFLSLGTNSAAARLHLSGNISAASWTTNGIALRVDAATYTNTTSSGTVADTGVITIGTPTLAASSSTTYSIASTLRISNSPTAGTNVTITEGHALHVDNGNVRFDGGIAAGGFGIGSTGPKYNFGIGHSLPAINWGVNGVALRLNAGTVTDTTTADGATVAAASIHSILRPTLAATNAATNITYTTSATLYIVNAPLAGTNVTITTPLALQVGAGNVIFNGSLAVGASAASNTELFQLNGNFTTTAWTTNGVRFRAVGRTYTDTSSSGTVATVCVDAFQRPTIAASNSVTYTTAATILITNAPIAGTNVTFTNSLALLIDDGDVRMDGRLICNANSNNPTAALSVLNLGISAAAWGTSGIHCRFTAGIATDTSTADGATVTNVVTNSFSVGTLNATNASSGITYTHAANIYIQNAMTAGSNVTITNGYSIWVDNGDVRFDARLGVGPSMSASPVSVLQINGGGTFTAASGTSGYGLRINGSVTYTDSASSGTVTNNVVHGVGRPTVAASSTTTYTNSATFYITNSPLAGSNVTQTNPYAFWIDDGVARLDGNVMIGCTGTPIGALTINGMVVQNVNTQSGTTYTVTVTDHTVSLTNTAARTITMPAASACFDSTNTAGGYFVIIDSAFTAATANVTINRAGSDTFVGGGTSVTIVANGGCVKIQAISTTQWAVVT